jgi:alginate O-acetyltransferase complex protein AlgI
LTGVFGPGAGLLAGFLFSGLVHELVISVPAAGGYGGPTLFFGLQAAGLLFERSGLGRSLGLGEGWRGWAFTMLLLVLPMYVLFHPPFMVKVVVPFMAMLGAA